MYYRAISNSKRIDIRTIPLFVPWPGQIGVVGSRGWRESSLDWLEPAVAGSQIVDKVALWKETSQAGWWCNSPAFPLDLWIETDSVLLLNRSHVILLFKPLIGYIPGVEAFLAGLRPWYYQSLSTLSIFSLDQAKFVLRHIPKVATPQDPISSTFLTMKVPLRIFL